MTRPAIKGKPRKSRHVVESSQRDNRACQAAVQVDVAACVAWLGAMPTRSLSTQGVRDWGAAQGWTPGYLAHIVEQVRMELRRCTSETVEQARARLITKSEQLMESITDYKYGRGAGEHAGTEVLMDPTTGEPIRVIDQTAALAHLRFQADLLIPKETERSLHVHVQNDMAHLSDAELRAIIAKPVQGKIT